jgi:ankyrin repeat protein
LFYFTFVDGVDEAYFQSARIGDVKTLHNFILSGVSVNARDSKGNSAIVIAAGRGQVNIIAFLLDNGASIEDYTHSGLFEGKTALCWAASQGRTQAVGMLLQAGADPNRLPDRGVFQGKTALMWASSQGRVGVVRLLLSAGVDVNFSSQTGNFKVNHKLLKYYKMSQGFEMIIYV